MTSPSPSTSASDSAAESGRPRPLLLGLWALVVLSTLWRAEDLRDWLLEDDRAVWMGTAADAWVALADRTGASALRDHSETARAALYRVGEPEVLARVASIPPPLPAAETHHVSVHTSSRASTRPPAHDIAPRPKRVLLLGASSMQFAIGQAFEHQLAAYEDLVVRRVAKVSTGLSRPDEFNWPARLEELLAESEPDLVIVNFGGNDAQNIPLPQRQRAVFGTTAWDDEYGRRVRDFVARIRARNAHAVMIGMPIMRSPDFSAKMQRLNRVTESATRAAGGIYLDQWDLAATPDGKYREYVDDGRKARPMRMEDGIHYSIAGGRHVVARLLPRLERVVRLVPKDAKLGRVEAHAFQSAALGKPARYLAWLPRLAAGERVPLLVLLHGADGKPEDFSEHLHLQLAAAAQQHRLAIVAPDGGDAGWWLDSPERTSSRYASLVASDLLADVRAHLPVQRVAGIAGISMGGHGALTIALEHGEEFRSASSVSGVVDLTQAADRPALAELLGPLETQRQRWESRSAARLFERAPERARRLQLRLSCGVRDRWIEANRALHARATELGISHDYDEAPAGHEWSYWEQVIPEHVGWHARVLTAPNAP